MAVNWTEGSIGIAQRTVTRLDLNGDGALSAAEAPGCGRLDVNGTPGIQVDELRVWLERADTYEPTLDLDHVTWAAQTDAEELDDLRGIEAGWKTATIATGVVGAALLLLGLISALTGVGAAAALAIFLGAGSSIACPIAGAEWSDAHAATLERIASNEDRRCAIASTLERVATAPRPESLGPLGALTPPRSRP